MVYISRNGGIIMVNQYIKDKIDILSKEAVVEDFPYRVTLEVSENQISEGKVMDAQESIDKLRVKYRF